MKINFYLSVHRVDRKEFDSFYSVMQNAREVVSASGHAYMVGEITIKDLEITLFTDDYKKEVKNEQ